MATKSNAPAIEPEIISASEFKAKCLAILDRVQRTGIPVTVTKRGRPVATVGPAIEEKVKVKAGFMKEYTTWVGDVVSPLPREDWGRLG